MPSPTLYSVNLDVPFLALYLASRSRAFPALARKLWNYLPLDISGCPNCVCLQKLSKPFFAVVSFGGIQLYDFVVVVHLEHRVHTYPHLPLERYFVKGKRSRCTELGAGICHGGMANVTFPR